MKTYSTWYDSYEYNVLVVLDYSEYQVLWYLYCEYVLQVLYQVPGTGVILISTFRHVTGATKHPTQRIVMNIYLILTHTFGLFAYFLVLANTTTPITADY